LSELRELARKENLLVVDELVESQTAKIPGRPVFNEMIERLERGEASGILAWHPDRLARNSIDGGRIIHLVDTGKIRELKFPTFWFEPTPQGKFMLSIMFGQSKYYVDSLSENIRRGSDKKSRTASGRWLRRSDI
jgi:DNA invertase Pin-like site-specific DNA recombinase